MSLTYFLGKKTEKKRAKRLRKFSRMYDLNGIYTEFLLRSTFPLAQFSMCCVGGFIFVVSHESNDFLTEIIFVENQLRFECNTACSC